MKISENWLRSLVDLGADSAALAHRLNMIGHEVESAERVGEGLAGVVVAQIVACEKHPQADRLSVCKVNAGTGAPLQIVCGAPNARAGLKAPLAMIGATLPDGTMALRNRWSLERTVISSGGRPSARSRTVDRGGSAGGPVG